MSLLGRFAPYLVALLLVGAGLFGAYHHGETLANSQWQARWNKRDADDQQTRADAEAHARVLEQQRQQQAEQVQRDATQRLEQARTDAAGAGAAADGLRNRVQVLLHAASGGSGHSGTCTGGPTVTNPGNLLAVVLDQSVQRNRELAAVADTARVKGLACEAQFDALKAR
ncbi:DUF2514 family protein [Pseudomonas gingeri]|uniref:DUF2514 family protein n=1 Tax=Pseudomonas gingeri TaxID=117681 RepID=A0A7Y8C0Y3_9PSED|nr:DUF2514 family protein [Pseudomonas gingeri]NWD73264.1 DUF2514 family protein [Pseudomonas gingeri]